MSLTLEATANRPITYQQYDNLGEVVLQEQYQGNLFFIKMVNGVPAKPPDKFLLARTQTGYDAQGRPYVSKVYSVDPSTHVVGGFLATTPGTTATATSPASPTPAE